MSGGTHWYNQNNGRWPIAACGHQIDRDLSDEYTLWMSRVSCPQCKMAVQVVIDALRPERSEVDLALDYIKLS
jgi:hypothetical protein